MKSILVVVVLVLACALAAASKADVGAGGRITADLVVDSLSEVIEMEFAVPADGGAITGVPRSFTLFSNDATEFWIQRRFAGGVRDTVPIHIPAGRSILLPAPPPVMDSAGDYYRVTIFVGGHTDSVYALPWYE